MAFSKFNEYPKRDQMVALYCKAFGHPARKKIIEKLAGSGCLKVTTICLGHPLSQPSMAEHFRILRKAGLIRGREEYPYTYYEVEEKNCQEAIGCVQEFCQELLEGLQTMAERQ